MKYLSKNKIDSVIIPFTEERREIRKSWNYLTKYISWDIYLESAALLKLLS